jgi:hypothetical protein
LRQHRECVDCPLFALVVLRLDGFDVAFGLAMSVHTPDHRNIANLALDAVVHLVCILKMLLQVAWTRDQFAADGTLEFFCPTDPLFVCVPVAALRKRSTTYPTRELFLERM